MWLLHHQKKHGKVILDIWLKEVRRQNNPEKLLCLVYLANDVIQNSRKKYPDFMISFLKVLDPAFRFIRDMADENCRKAVLRIIHVWRDRNIYKPVDLSKLERIFDTESNNQLPSSNEMPIKPETEVKNAKPGLENFSMMTTKIIGVLRKLEDPASADAGVRQQIADFPENIANPALLKNIANREDAQELMDKINEANPVVDSYCARLKAEMSDRRMLQKLVADYVETLTLASERNKEMIKSVREKIEQLDQDKIELKKHIESLPDLNEMLHTDFSLPSAHDLFT
uniref:CID domain-containing protein n=1 Tax=Acrobeloides nanus TaxID=290746 RepID=A0A914CAK3_9BILA